jgi:hypothetical protein
MVGPIRNISGLSKDAQRLGGLLLPASAAHRPEREVTKKRNSLAINSETCELNFHRRR